MMNYKLIPMPRDVIGPEMIDESVKVIEKAAEKVFHSNSKESNNSIRILLFLWTSP